MGDVSVVESAVIRQLQHAILQLCNEHVSYEHSLQVLGVLCVTVDDQPRDVVVKLNNTLKRVDAVTTGSDDRRVGIVRSSAPTTWPRVAGGSDATAACGSSATAGSSTAGYNDSLLGRQGVTACIEAAPVATVSGCSQRKCHGRKQSNPVKVKTVMDEDDNDVDGSNTSDYHAGSMLLIAPAEPSAAENDHVANTSPPSSPRLLRSVGGEHCGIDEELPRHGRHHGEIPSPDVGGSSSVRTILTSMVENSDVNPGISSCTPRSLLSSSLVDTTPNATEYRSSDSVADKLRRNSASVSVQEAALNFSTRTSDQAEDGETSPNCSGGSGADIKIKEEMHHPALPLTYGLDLGGRHSGTFDMSSSLSVAAAAVALSQYVDDPATLQSLTSYDQQRLALYTSLVTAAAASGVPPGCNEQPPPISLLNGAGRNDGTDVPSSLERPLAMSSYAMSGQLGDRLSMHRLPAIRRRERFERGLYQSHQPPMKVKDIIMYDDSAPLHVQRGSRIEGDFMVDALHVEGRKRRRRTAEDTLSAEEIAEYMGTSTSSGNGQFICRYCGEVSTDLSRYFAHTLTAHGSFVCHQCGKSFTTKSSLLRHRPIHTGMRRFACSICRKSFYRKDKCKAHIKRHLGLTDGPGPGLSSSPAVLPCSSGPATPQLPPSVDHQLFASSVGPVNLAV